MPSQTSISSLAHAQAPRALDVDVDLFLVRLRLVVLEPLGARRQVEVVDAERRHSERPPQLLDHAVELVQPGHVVSRHVPSVRFSSAYRASIVVPSASTRDPRISVLVLAGCGSESDDGTPEASGTTTQSARRRRSRRRGAVRLHPERLDGGAGSDARVRQGGVPDRRGGPARRGGGRGVPPGEPVPNDYYIRNPDKSTETLPVATDAEITARRCPLCRKASPATSTSSSGRS